MRAAYGEGLVVAVLLPFVLYFLGFLNLPYTLFLVVILIGSWTVVSAFVLVKREELRIYFTWGLILACASTLFVISLTYAIALILIAIIASVFVFVSTRKR